MEPAKRPSPPPEFHLSVSADRSSLKDVVKALLHTIFFHRTFTPLSPSTHEILDLTLPYLPDLSPFIDSKIALLSDRGGTLKFQFLEKKRRKGWFVSKADEETVWESWIIDASVFSGGGERGMLKREALKVVEICMRERGHIPPITTNEREPFGYNIAVSGR